MHGLRHALKVFAGLREDLPELMRLILVEVEVLLRALHEHAPHIHRPAADGFVHHILEHHRARNDAADDQSAEKNREHAEDSLEPFHWSPPR